LKEAFENQKLQIDQKDKQLAETETMFKEYQSWRGKLETIETRMR
jgi:hypothetical protein